VNSDVERSREGLKMKPPAKSTAHERPINRRSRDAAQQARAAASGDSGAMDATRRHHDHGRNDNACCERARSAEFFGDAGKPGARIFVRNRAVVEHKECRVVRIQERHEGKSEVGVEFLQADAKFWGLEFPPDDWQ
jgi:hypothetical protein